MLLMNKSVDTKAKGISTTFHLEMLKTKPHSALHWVKAVLVTSGSILN